jgi:hypothetical protein
MARVEPTVQAVLEDKQSLDWVRGIIACAIYLARQSPGSALSPKSAFERANSFIEEWKAQSGGE